jgi:hypothetical protein
MPNLPLLRILKEQAEHIRTFINWGWTGELDFLGQIQHLNARLRRLFLWYSVNLGKACQLIRINSY